MQAGLTARRAAGIRDETTGALKGAALVFREGVEAFFADLVENRIDLFLDNVYGGIPGGVAFASSLMVDLKVNGETASFGRDEFELGTGCSGARIGLFGPELTISEWIATVAEHADVIPAGDGASDMGEVGDLSSRHISPDETEEPEDNVDADGDGGEFPHADAHGDNEINKSGEDLLGERDGQGEEEAENGGRSTNEVDAFSTTEPSAHSNLEGGAEEPAQDVNAKKVSATEDLLDLSTCEPEHEHVHDEVA